MLRNLLSRSRHLFLVAAALSCFAAQANTVLGFVLDADRRPVEHATVYNTTLRGHDHTDALGRFELTGVEAGDSLRVEAIGYLGQTLAVPAPGVVLSVVLSPLAVDLASVVIVPAADATRQIQQLDLHARPTTSSQELLRTVPGLFIGQHAGGGKAEQMFLRGFDIDHGTDIAIAVDGLPVNMVSHAHGQGYADLHFVIPETIERIDYTKGPYDARVGNFATAASVDLHTMDRLRENLVRVDVGEFNLRRVVGLVSVLDRERQSAYVALEALGNDGPFVSPQKLRRYNGLIKSEFILKDGARVTGLASHFTSSWLASGQVPQRAIDQGLIGRFGAIDDREGGSTSRSNLSAEYFKPLGHAGLLKARAYVSHYDFELYSNFTFFLNDPVNGDEIRQREDRYLGGALLEYSDHFEVGGRHIESTVGVSTRIDQTRDSELSQTFARTTTLSRTRLGDIAEQTGSAYGRLESSAGDWTGSIGLRFDATRYAYVDQLEASAKTTASAASLNPKLQIQYRPQAKVQAFLRLGSGYHANDARLVVGDTDLTFMPKAYGADLGLVLQPIESVILTATAWYLDSQQEFVYVGDAGVVEPSGRSRRMGIDLGTRLSLKPDLAIGADLTLAQPRAVDEPDGADLIPLGVPLGMEAFAVYQPTTGFRGQARLRLLGDRPANEDNSIVAEGYEVVDVTVGYAWRMFTLSLIADNVFDVEWNETQFATESRLRDEPAPVEEIHFTPGVPRNFRGRLTWTF